jgi:hypothetical protein
MEFVIVKIDRPITVDMTNTNTLDVDDFIITCKTKLYKKSSIT